MRALALTLAAGVAVLLGGCHTAPGYPANPVTNPDEVADFNTLYSENCTACHGRNGQNGPAIDLANPEYQALIDDATMHKWIATGMPGTQMPAFAQSAGGMLTDAQIDALVAGMRSQWRAQNAFAGDAPPSYAQVQAGDPHRGAQVYATRCARCHKAAQQDITSPTYLALVSNQALRSIIIAGRPDIGTPDWRHVGSGGPLTAQEVDDLVAYFRSLRNSTQAAGGR